VSEFGGGSAMANQTHCAAILPCWTRRNRIRRRVKPHFLQIWTDGARIKGYQKVVLDHINTIQILGSLFNNAIPLLKTLCEWKELRNYHSFLVLCLYGLHLVSEVLRAYIDYSGKVCTIRCESYCRFTIRIGNESCEMRYAILNMRY